MTELPAGLLPGNPCWLSIGSTQPDVSRDFYATLFRWQYRAQAGSAIALMDGIDVAEIADASARHPDYWVVHLTMRNPWLVVERIRQYGGRILHGPVVRQDGSSSIIAADSEGTVIAAAHPAQHWQFRRNEPGCFTWADLNTHDGQRADRFFHGVFGYSQGQVGDGVDLDYAIWWVNNTAVVGRYRMGSEFPASTKAHWAVFFQTLPDLGTDTTADLAVQSGGKIIVEPYDSSYGRAAVLADPTGAQFSIIDQTPDDETFSARVDDPYDD